MADWKPENGVVKSMLGPQVNSAHSSSPVYGFGSSTRNQYVFVGDNGASEKARAAHTLRPGLGESTQHVHTHDQSRERVCCSVCRIWRPRS